MVDLERFIAAHRETRQLDGAFLREVGETGGGVVRPLAELSEYPVALLLGEPGSGKSHALQWLSQHLQDRQREWVVRTADLFQHSEYSLESKLFDPLEAAMLVDRRQYVLLLDSLDECRARIGTLVGVLERRLTEAVRGGLRVVASCRSGELVVPLRNLFQRLGSDDALFDLQPLQASDVERYAEGHSVDGLAFLRQIRAARAEPLAAIPQTLELLCAAAHADVTLFQRRNDLYEFGVRKLLELSVRGNEPYEGGRARASRSLWLAAERAAALTSLTAASGVWTRSTSAENGAMHWQVIAEREPDGTGSTVELVAADALAALAGPLFASAGPEVRTVAHRSFGAYLTRILG